ncbi:MAG: HAMP domain-containing histidine kinase [Bdellovibrionales bacterium]|nr:HAMP domain-containing histidine kinase [Bdellovibrionales bacterium]
MILTTLVLLSVASSITALVLAARSYVKITRENRLLRDRAERAERNLRHVGDLANEVAHEIKNPLTAILCSTETLHLVLQDQIDEVHRSSLRYMKEYGDYLLRLVSDFLDLSRAETDRLDVIPEKVAISEVAESIIGLLNAQALERNIALSASVDEYTQISFDPKHVKQIIFNLVHNALKFTHQGGQVIIQVTKDVPARKVWIAVTDNGVGIAEERLEAVFEPYWTSGESGKNHVLNGTGLGLSLCRALAQANGSDLQVKSTLGVGTTFWFSADLLDDRGEHPRRQRPSEVLSNSSPLVGQRFLVIDGENGISDSIAQLIQAWGGMVDAVHNASDMVTALAGEEYDAVMVEGCSSDGVFPPELVGLAREHRKSDHTAIIVTGESEDSHGHAADCCLEKPYTSKALLRSLLHTGKFSVTH